MIVDLLIDRLPDLGNLVPVHAGKLNPEGRYLLLLDVPTPPDPARVKKTLRRLGLVASYKYLIDWPDGYQIYLVMPDEGTTAEQYYDAVKPYSAGALLALGKHPSLYAVPWDTSAAIETTWDEFPVKTVLIVAAAVVVVLLLVNINVEG